MTGQFVFKLGFLLVLGVLWVGCSGKEKPAKPRTRDEIFLEIQALPTLYLTGETRTEIITSGNKGNFIDEKTGEICWRVMECTNPDCPGKGAEGKPLKFVTPDPAMYAKSDGTIGYDKGKSKQSEKMAGGACPGCLKGRNLKTESDAVRNKYAKWVKPHVLPESAERKEELEAELERTSN